MFWAMDCNGLFTTVVPDKTDAFLSGAESTGIGRKIVGG